MLFNILFNIVYNISKAELIEWYILWYHIDIYFQVDKCVGFKVSHPQNILSAKSCKHERDVFQYPSNKQLNDLEWKKV